MIEYEKVLNPMQLEAVMTLQGPLLVIAGAGSGKTRTLTYRVARLVETGVDPEAILLLTFTRKASQEMLERAAALSDSRCTRVSGGTFHSLAHRVLRGNAELAGYSPSFTILDRADMEEVIQSLVPDLGLPKGTPRFPKRGTLANILSKSANLQCPVDNLIADEFAHFVEFTSDINTLGELYRGYKKKNQLMDYDDLIINFRDILAHSRELRTRLGLKYGYIMVDEYQDTNSIQADISRYLADEHGNIMVVGDDSQSIYSFRGANYRNMFEFTDHFPEARIIKLEENYRSTQPILSFTNALMDGAVEKYTKCLFTKRGDGERPKIVDTGSDPGQAAYVCRFIQEQVGKGKALKDHAVLFRAGYHSFELEAELTRQGVPYVKYGGFKFLESAHIKDFIAHLRVLVNRDEAVSWGRVLGLIKNVGRAKTRDIIRWMRESDIPPEEVASWPGRGGRDNRGLKDLGSLFRKLSSNKIAPKQAVSKVMDYYGPILEEKFDDHPRRRKELEQLIRMSKRYRKLRGFLDDLVLEPPASSADIGMEKGDDCLTLSTIHSAKGLEWPVVFIIWLKDGRFPPAQACSDDEALEEERRLMYVAATRAKDRLIMCYPGRDTGPAWAAAYSGGNNSGPSCLLNGIPDGITSFEASKRGFSFRDRGKDIIFGRRRGAIIRRENASGGRDRSLKPTEGENGGNGFCQGEKVNHPAFGPGVVSRLIGSDKVEVLFSRFGRKLLHLQYTTLEKG